ncbi:MAG TPA: FtsQ-type POTRA domain-containing protein [Chloroflexota bacterium]|nr:FtsQ-type POTRA domain-containing protein [Chloroflexota bacterium]
MSRRIGPAGRGVLERRTPRPQPRTDGHAPRNPGKAPASGSSAVWLLAKLLALLLLFAASGLLYHVATSDGFRVTRVAVAGNQLLSASELEATAAVDGANIFWLRQAEVKRRLEAVPSIQSARISAFLPNRLEIQIAERTPIALWQNGETSFLVDRDGRVLGSGPNGRSLPAIRDVGRSDLRAGESVDTDALQTVFRLQTLLPQLARTAAREFEYSRETGVSVVTDFGARVRFGRGDGLEWKVNALAAVRRELERTNQRAELIDVRFGDRPYVR